MDLETFARDLALNLVAITLLAYVFYFRRHGRRDLLVGYFALNVSLFAVSSALGSASSLTIGFGFGLFAVLSIIRLRSDETTQAEIGYMMVALVIGLITGLEGISFTLTVLLVVVLLAVMYIVDHPAVTPGWIRTKHRITLEYVESDLEKLRNEAEARLGGKVLTVNLRTVDFVRETTEADVVVRRSASSKSQLESTVR